MQTGLAGSLSWRMGPWKWSVMLIADNTYWTKVKGQSSDFLFIYISEALEFRKIGFAY